jgi:predicted nucleic-acid-binding Zn-ribbon protein
MAPLEGHGMPPDIPEPVDARLTEEQNENLAAWLSTHWTKWDCPFHGDTTWSVGEILHGAQAFFPKGAVNVSKSYPVVVLTCNSCGYTVFVNAIVAGLIPRDQSEPVVPTPEPITTG